MTNGEDTRSRRRSRDAPGTRRPSDRLRGGSALASLTAAVLAGWIGGCVSVGSLEQAASAGLPGRYLEVNGIRVHVEERGVGEPVLLVHGFGGSTFSWRAILPDLETRYRVIAVDLPGFGFSERPAEARRYSRVAQVETLIAVVDALGVTRAHWVGHSYGGGLVATLAHRQPHRIRSLVLIDSTAPDYAERRRNFRGRRWFAFPYIRTIALRPRFVRRVLERSFFDDSAITEELVSAYLDRVRIEGVVDAWVGLTAPQPDPGDGWTVSLEELAHPMLVLWGEEDTLISVESGRRSTAAIPGARFVSIPDCGHIPMEENPARVAEEMLAFFDQVSRGDAGPASR